ncbi:haloacid dehalogenase-like hydrolase [Burkholderia multivorans]|uniref:haloacid dehalogenase-like hydrolase n=1 Tax=Burkholderia multivorans TaxID=87883 RepID=UPI001C25D73B|nr:haloacid dehalogenase-like hydrolase [Burkholderia multivorans]MBU9544619.1 haloacid dehalogenase-like hydrolase [Burkholderia multivorans]MCA8177195.1 haloacid dehalogenase-like hydrolase [Burkholderia multivorans]
MPKLYRRLLTALAASLCMTFAHAADLAHWPADSAKALNAMIAAHAHRGDYAVFDADNTTYRYDLEESLLPYLERRGVLTRDTLDASLKLIPFKDSADYKESLTSYYYRLCEIDDLVCYPWIAQAFAGLSLADLKRHIDAMLADGKPIPIRYWQGDKVVDGTANPPRFFRGMQELYNALRENGIEVYVMTAAHEELARLVLSDPKYGYNVKPENVIGVTTLLRNPATGALTTSRLQIKAGKYDEAANRNLVITPFLMNPMTWYEGKLGSIVGWIDQWKKPVLVAGDTPASDGYMLLNATDVARGGVRVWVDKKDKQMARIRAWSDESAAKQKALGLPVTADRNWIVVKPDAIQ